MKIVKKKGEMKFKVILEGVKNSQPHRTIGNRYAGISDSISKLAQQLEAIKNKIT